MKEPIKAGDKCLVVGGQGRQKSPNLGKTVTVKHRVYGEHGGDHSTLGTIFLCEGDDVQQLGDAGNYVITGWAHFSVNWLQKIEPPKLTKTATVESDMTA